MNPIRIVPTILTLLFSLALTPLLSAAPAPEPASAHLAPNDLLAITGDSITEQLNYSVDIEAYLLACQPAPNLRAHQFGVSGEQAGGLLARLDNDVLPFHPTVVTTFYGMNDGLYAAITDKVRDNYYRNEKAVVEKLKKAGVRWIVVGSPGCVDSDRYNPDKAVAVTYNQTLAALGEVGRKVAAEEGVSFADLHPMMMDVMAKAKAQFGPKYVMYGYDGIHPWSNGHLVIAYGFLKALGCDGNIGTITVDLAAGSAQATPGHKVLSDKNGSIEVESTRYPFCFFGDAVAPDGTQLNTRQILSCVPFNRDLNRFQLVVKTGAVAGGGGGGDAAGGGGASGAGTASGGASGGGRFRVEWLTPAMAAPGAAIPATAVKVFTAEQLAKGINLADEFMDNPFSAAFTRVHQLALAQQTQEQHVIRGLVETLGAIPNVTPEEAQARQVLIAGQVRRLKPALEATAAAVQPVRHVIRIRRLNEADAAMAPAPPPGAK